MQETSSVEKKIVTLESRGDVHASPKGPTVGRRLAVTALVLVLFAVCYFAFGDKLSIERLATYETFFRAFYEQRPVLTYAIAFAIYVTVAGLSLPGAAAMTLLMGWLFGLWRGVILVSFASTAGASIAFLLSRYLLRESIQGRFGARLTGFNQALTREGALYLFTLRLIPAVPFFVINVVMGLTPVRLGTFWWVSQLGMLPGTSVYVYAGSNVPTLQELAKVGVGGILTKELIISFVLIGLFPLLVKRLTGWLRPSRSTATSDTSIAPFTAKTEDSDEPSNSSPDEDAHRLNGAHDRRGA